MASLIKIVPLPPHASGTPTQGIRFFVDGAEIKGIRKVTLIAEPHSVWVANLELTIDPPEELIAELGEIVTHT